MSVRASRVRRRRPAALVVALVALVTGLLPLGVGGGASAHPGHEHDDDRAAAAAAPVMKEGFRDTVVLEGLDVPVAAEEAPDGRVIVLEKSGRLVTYDGFDDTTPTVSLNIRRDVMSYIDRGALGLALDPDFATNGDLYLMFTYNYRLGDDPATVPKWNKYRTDGSLDTYYDECPTVDVGCEVSNRLVRYTMNPTTDIATQEQVLITDWCQQYFSHSAGSLAFGADGYLYASAGEGARYEGSEPDFGQYGGNPCDDPVPSGNEQGGRLRSQDVRTLDDPTTLSGSVIRIDPATGLPAPGNPLSANAQADTNAKRIVAHGFRNPFRLTVRPGTNELYVGDVGQSQYEEVNRVPADRTVLPNLGWPCYEGTPKFGAHRSDTGFPKPLCASLYQSGGATAPFFSYRHADETVAGDGCQVDTGSISALAFAEDRRFPTSVRGALVFGDYSRGCLWFMPAGAGGVPDASAAQLLGPASLPVDLFTGRDGSLYYVDISGSIHRLTYDPGRPTAKIAVADGYQPYGRDLPLTIRYTAAGSSDPTNDALSYAWDLDGDGQFDDATGLTAQRAYSDGSRNVVVSVRVSDGANNSDVARLTVYPGTSPPVLTVAAPDAGLRWAVAQEIGYRASATDGGAALPASAIDWSFTIQHCPAVDVCHAHPLEDAPDRAEGSFKAIDHELPSHIQAQVTVTNPRGLTDTEVIRLDPAALDVTIGSSPPGFQVIVDGRPRSTDLEQRLIAGARLQVSTRAYQRRDGRLWRFSSWTGGRPRTHELVLPRRTSYEHRATFVPVKRRFTLLTSPAGLRAGALGAPRRHGFSAQVQVGQEVRVTAPRTQTYRGYRYRFVRWNDGGAIAHTFTMPQRDTYRRAVYRRVGRA